MYLISSSQNLFKLHDIQKKKPLYIPPPPSDYEALNRLVYNSRPIDT